MKLLLIGFVIGFFDSKVTDKFIIDMKDMKDDMFNFFRVWGIILVLHLGIGFIFKKFFIYSMFIYLIVFCFDIFSRSIKKYEKIKK
ncbi:MAG: hypothetical protein ACERKZ_14325 [Lachnotalea sp.]